LADKKPMHESKRTHYGMHSDLAPI